MLGDILRESHYSTDIAIGLFPRAQFPSLPLNFSALPDEKIFIGPQDFTRQAAAVHFFPMLGNFREDFVMKAINQIDVLFQGVVLLPTMAMGDIAHFLVEHGDGNGCMFDE